MLIRKAWPLELPGARVSSSKVSSFVHAGETPAREVLHEAEAVVHPFQTRLETHSQRRILLLPASVHRKNCTIAHNIIPKQID